MNVDRELDWQVLASDWQALEQPLPPQSLERLAARVRARGRLLATWVIGECTIAVVAIAVLLRLAINANDLANSVAMWSLTAIAASTTAFGLWNWRGAWRPVAASQQAYIDLSIARCARMRRAASAGYWVLAAEVVCFVPWIAAGLINSGAGLRGYAAAYLYLGAFVAGAILALRAIHRWVAREEDAVRGFGELSEMHLS
jgi:hypothetical protein